MANHTQEGVNYYHTLVSPGVNVTAPPPPVPVKRFRPPSQHTTTPPKQQNPAQTPGSPNTPKAPPLPALPGESLHAIPQASHSPTLPSGSPQARSKAPPPAVLPRRGYTYEPFPGNTMSLPPKRASKVTPRLQSRESVPTPPQLPKRTYSVIDTNSPAVPTSPRPLSVTITPTTSNRRIVIKEPAEKQISDGLSLAQLAEKYSQQFPVRIRVLKGYCGQTSRLTISTQDTYNIHFVKHTKVVVIRDAYDTPYSIPLNSAVEFGIVYNPNHSRSESLNGLTFQMVSDIMALPTMPRVICAQRAIRGDDERTSIYENERLVVKGTHKSKFKGKKSLKLYSTLTKKDKVLTEDTVGLFTTEPYHCRMYLPELMEQIQDPFPGKAVLFLNTDAHWKPEAAAQVQDLPPALFTKVVRMEGCFTESTLVASSTTRGEFQPGDSHYDPETDMIFDIPIHEKTLKDVEVAVVELVDTNDTEKLYDDTRNIFEKFDPSKVMTCKDASTETAYVAQNLFYNAVRPGCEKVGVEIDTPSAIYDNARLLMMRVREQQQKEAQAKSKTTSLQRSVQAKSETTSLQRSVQAKSETTSLQRSVQAKSETRNPQRASPPRLRMPSQPEETSSSYDVVDYDLEDDTSHFYEDQDGQNETLRLAIQALEKRVCSLEKKDGEVSHDMGKLKGNFEPVARQVRALDIKVQQLSTVLAASKQQAQMTAAATQLQNGDHGGRGDASFEQANKTFLESLNGVQIQNLLEAMGLTQYKDIFAMEQVTGELLLELEEDDLQNELGVTSRIHRVRLMKVIRGLHSAKNILSGIDPYVSFGSH